MTIANKCLLTINESMLNNEGVKWSIYTEVPLKKEAIDDVDFVNLFFECCNEVYFDIDFDKSDISLVLNFNEEDKNEIKYELMLYCTEYNTYEDFLETDCVIVEVQLSLEEKDIVNKAISNLIDKEDKVIKKLYRKFFHH